MIGNVESAVRDGVPGGPRYSCGTCRKWVPSELKDGYGACEREVIKLSIDMRGACPMPTGELARRVDGCMFPEDGSCCWWSEYEG